MTDPARPGRSDRYEQMMALADVFDVAGAELRHRAALAGAVLGDPAVSDSAELSPRTFEPVESLLRAVSTGKVGLQTRSVELDADALVVRATVLTYRWIDELQQAAYDTLGTIAGRAVGYLAPQVALGGAILSAGLIDTDSLERDDVAAYLSELAEQNPDLREHLTSGGGGLLESLRMRALLTAGVPAEPPAGLSETGLQRVGAPAFPAGAAAALRDAGAAILPDVTGTTSGPGLETAAAPPAGMEALIERLLSATASIQVERVAPQRYVAYLPGPHVGMRGLRLVGGSGDGYAAEADAALRSATAAEPGSRVLLVGLAQGGVAAARLASGEVDQPDDAVYAVAGVVVAGSPAAQVPRLPDGVRMLALEERTDPVALLGAVLNVGDDSRTTVVFESTEPRPAAYAVGGRAVDESAHPHLVAEVARLRAQGFLGG